MCRKEQWVSWKHKRHCCQTWNICLYIFAHSLFLPGYFWLKPSGARCPPPKSAGARLSEFQFSVIIWNWSTIILLWSLPRDNGYLIAHCSPISSIKEYGFSLSALTYHHTPNTHFQHTLCQPRSALTHSPTTILTPLNPAINSLKWTILHQYLLVISSTHQPALTFHPWRSMRLTCWSIPNAQATATTHFASYRNLGLYLRKSLYVISLIACSPI